jgi:HEPN domain-containing protein
MDTNYTQGRSWITSAINDIKIVLNGLKDGYYSLVAFRSQFAVEKLNKAILSFMGLKAEKSHTPTDILDDILKNEPILTIDEESKKILEKISKYSKFFEKQGTQTRYGTIKDKKLITAEEIYKSFEDVKDFIKNLQNIVIYYLKFLKETLNITNKEFEDLEQFESLLGDFNKWI